MTVDDALRAAGVPKTVADSEAPLAERAMLERQIGTQSRASMFLAQVLHESGGLHYFEEIASGAAYEGRADLGNTQPGDGKRFKGRGPIQLTGRGNYRSFGHQLKLDLEKHPEMASQHAIGWRIAGLYWKGHGLNELADKGDFTTITLKINGATRTLPERQRWLDKLSGTDCTPSDRWTGYTADEKRWISEYDRTTSPDRRRV